MKSFNRLPLAFGIAIVVLTIVAVVLVLTMAGGEDVRLLPEDTPEGTVQRFLLAVEDEDYLKAYSYLSPPTSEDVPYESMRKRLARSGEKLGWKATLGKSLVMDAEATVDVVVNVFSPRGPFENPVRTHHITFFLKKTEASWSITSPVDLWWLY